MQKLTTGKTCRVAPAVNVQKLKLKRPLLKGATWEALFVGCLQGSQVGKGNGCRIETVTSSPSRKVYLPRIRLLAGCRVRFGCYGRCMTEANEKIPSQAPPTVILSHRTAMSYYRTLDPSHEQAARATKALPLAKARASNELLKTFNRAYSGFGGAPFDLLVPSTGLRRSTSELIAHSCEYELPSNSFWKLKDSLYVVSPELCFVQMAQQLSIAQLVELGINLCGSYFERAATSPSARLSLRRSRLQNTSKE